MNKSKMSVLNPPPTERVAVLNCGLGDEATSFLDMLDYGFIGVLDILTHKIGDLRGEATTCVDWTDWGHVLHDDTLA